MAMTHLHTHSSALTRQAGSTYGGTRKHHYVPRVCSATCYVSTGGCDSPTRASASATGVPPYFPALLLHVGMGLFLVVILVSVLVVLNIVF